MFNHQVFEQFIALQNKSFEMTEGVRHISNDVLKKLSEKNLDASKYLSSMMQEYFDKFGMVHDPATIPELSGFAETHEILKYLEEYQANVDYILEEGNQKLLAVLEKLSDHARGDYQNIVHGMTSNGALGTEPFMSVFRLIFDSYINSCDQMAATTKNMLSNWGRSQLKG